MAEDDDRALEWKRAEQAKTVADDGVPLAVSEEKTPQVEHTGKIRLTPQMFADKVELAEGDGYRRGLEHGDAAGYKRGREEALAEVVTELRAIREDGVEAFRAFFMIWNGSWPATWEEAEKWYRAHLTPL